MTRKQIDWEAVEQRFRLGVESLRAIAADFDITEGAIRQRAKKEKWSRDLSARVQQATEAVLMRRAATHDVRAEGEAVNVEANVRAGLILGHRKTIGRAQALTCRLFDEAEAQFDDAALLPVLAKADITVDGKPLAAGERAKLATALARARDLPTRASTIKVLSEALRLQVGLERQAFGIDKDAGGEDPSSQTEFRQRLLNARARAQSARS